MREDDHPDNSTIVLFVNRERVHVSLGANLTCTRSEEEVGGSSRCAKRSVMNPQTPCPRTDTHPREKSGLESERCNTKGTKEAKGAKGVLVGGGVFHAKCANLVNWVLVCVICLGKIGRMFGAWLNGFSFAHSSK